MENPFETVRIGESVLSWLRRPRRKAGSTDLSWLGAAIVTASGEVRQDNQDRAIVARFHDQRNPNQVSTVLLLCDGMGGMVEGGKCADIAVSEFLDSLTRHPDRSPTDNLRQASLDANQAVFRAYRGRGGTTLTAALFSGANSAAVSVGDSRLFEISESKEISQISVDDTIAGELRRIHGNEHITSDLEPFSKRLAQYVGMGEELEPRTYALTTRKNWYLVYSDGVQSIPGDTIQKVVSSAETVSALVNRLVHVSIWCGGEDNASAICIGGDPTKPLPNEYHPRQSRIEIWDSFGMIEVLFATSQPQAKAAATGASISPSGQAARPAPSGVNQQKSDWKRSGSPKSKRGKRTETKKPKPEKEASGPPPPKQFQMEIVEDSSPTTTSEERNVESKK